MVEATAELISLIMGSVRDQIMDLVKGEFMLSRQDAAGSYPIGYSLQLNLAILLACYYSWKCLNDIFYI